MSNEAAIRAEKRAKADSDPDAYLATIESIELDIHPIDASAFYASAAISLKRIADCLERLEDCYVYGDHK